MLYLDNKVERRKKESRKERKRGRKKKERKELCVVRNLVNLPNW